MLRHILGSRGLALVAVAGIFAGGAVTVGASGGVGSAADHTNAALATLHLPHKSHVHGYGNPSSQAKPDDVTPDAEGTPRAIQGIPEDNPQHHPADGDGICDKGETIVKTTPSGVMVNVPCQAADGGKGKEHDKTPKASRTRGADDQEADETPGVHGNGNHGRGGTRGADDKTPEPDETERAD